MCLLCLAAASGPDQGPHVLCSTASDQNTHVPAPGPGRLPGNSVTRKAAWLPWGAGRGGPAWDVPEGMSPWSWELSPHTASWAAEPRTLAQIVCVSHWNEETPDVMVALGV